MTRKTAARKTLALASRQLNDAMMECSRCAKIFRKSTIDKAKAESAFRGALSHAIEKKAL